MASDPKISNRRLVLMMVGLLIVMLALSFAAVPLYRLFCAKTGVGGTTQRAAQLPGSVSNRKITIRFDSAVDAALPWHFVPEVSTLPLALGAQGMVNFKAHNNSNQPITGTAVYNVNPLKAGKYFNKIQCFCFGQQTLNPGESVNMPVVFFVDPKMNDDPTLDDVQQITLSYTFYRADSAALDKATQKFIAKP